MVIRIKGHRDAQNRLQFKFATWFIISFHFIYCDIYFICVKPIANKMLNKWDWNEAIRTFDHWLGNRKGSIKTEQDCDRHGKYLIDHVYLDILNVVWATPFCGACKGQNLTKPKNEDHYIEHLEEIACKIMS